MKWLRKRKCRREGHQWSKWTSLMDMDAEGNLIGSGTIMWFCDCCGISSETDPSFDSPTQ